MRRFLWLGGSTPDEGGPDGRVAHTIRMSDQRTARDRTVTPLAFPERQDPPGGGLDEYRAARKDGTRAFTLWADSRRERVFARVATTSARKGGAATYEVLGAAGESLAVITRHPAMKRGLRTRWTVQQTGAGRAAGVKGRLFWWLVWWLTLPLQAVIVLLSAVQSGMADEAARTPRRTKWRAGWREGRRVILDYRRGPSSSFELEARADWWDDRVTAALVALLRSHDGWLGADWDMAG
ncbi:hypothetical protein [Streptomyces sp. Rer75]|uniref:hypothetical protein n=1 Tax=Streptomyces sp. Rer75 TaxID=2750011 RepID=UPI0015CFEFE5|nr:hypothetical protein [Streptomyces sp. Rer75]QLH24869.1 hypothetical protein HYQ63_32995 [Streptomyces sp. Rer75]